MMNPPFYKKLTMLNKKLHADWYVEPSDDLSFAAQSNSIFLLAAEFASAAREYPIIFVKSRDSVLSVVLVGLRENENLFMRKTENGKATWDAAYVPAYVRRYPFIPATAQEGKSELAVCFDKEFPGFNTEGRGERLFSADGTPGPALKKSLDFLQEFYDQQQKTMEFCNELARLDLLEPMKYNLRLKSGEKITLSGLLVVDRKKFAALEANQVNKLFRNGGLELIYAHLFSMDNMKRLARRLAGLVQPG
ncbi:MAG: hypothetical protein A2521_10865 [Deltaproteobacteria bacterium RIFOXYD12_FULL_57_12]|nr:MAG: hypothetical protein A2521_10865 [Deltaproteobacteria bacterium RIFOXYD12_FULL_57_12]